MLAFLLLTLQELKLVVHVGRGLGVVIGGTSEVFFQKFNTLGAVQGIEILPSNVRVVGIEFESLADVFVRRLEIEQRYVEPRKAEIGTGIQITIAERSQKRRLRLREITLPKVHFTEGYNCRCSTGRERDGLLRGGVGVRNAHLLQIMRAIPAYAAAASAPPARQNRIVRGDCFVKFPSTVKIACGRERRRKRRRRLRVHRQIIEPDFSWLAGGAAAGAGAWATAECAERNAPKRSMLTPPIGVVRSVIDTGHLPLQPPECEIC